MKKFRLDEQRILENATDLEMGLLHFLNDNEIHTLQRWLLTLTPDETQSLADQWEAIFNEEYTDEMSLIPLIILLTQGKYETTPDEYFELAKKVNASISLISLVHQGLLTYKMKENDDEWTFSMPEEIKKQIKNGELFDLL